MRIQRLFLLGAINVETIKNENDDECLKRGEKNFREHATLGGTVLKELESNNEIKKYCEKLLHFAEISDAHASLDTFARILFLQDTKESQAKLLELKMMISQFLLIEQIVHGIDKRYDVFLAYLFRKANGTIELPNNISIISWNYDLQLELAVARFLNRYNYEGIQETLRIVPSLGGNRQISYEHPLLVKLNGSAGLFSSGPYGEDSLLETKVGLNKSSSVAHDIEEVFKNFYGYITNREYKKEKGPGAIHRIHVDPYLTFAWEEVDVAIHARKTANNILRNSHTVTVIGYSFPLFNRDIDREIFNGSPLNRVYVQDTDDSISDVVQRFQAIDATAGKEIVPHSKVREFFVPSHYKFPEKITSTEEVGVTPAAGVAHEE